VGAVLHKMVRLSAAIATSRRQRARFPDCVYVHGYSSGWCRRRWRGSERNRRRSYRRGAEYRKRGWLNRGRVYRGHGRRPEHGLECFICQPCLVDPPGCCVPGLRIGVGRSSKRHGGDLTLDIQFESAAEFDYQGPEVRVSGVRG